LIVIVNPTLLLAMQLIGSVLRRRTQRMSPAGENCMSIREPSNGYDKMEGEERSVEKNKQLVTPVRFVPLANTNIDPLGWMADAIGASQPSILAE